MKRFCDCGRECEKRCRLCSECRAVNDAIRMDKARHTWKTKNPDKYKADYMKQNARPEVIKRKAEWKRANKRSKTA